MRLCSLGAIIVFVCSLACASETWANWVPTLVPVTDLESAFADDLAQQAAAAMNKPKVAELEEQLTSETTAPDIPEPKFKGPDYTLFLLPDCMYNPQAGVSGWALNPLTLQTDRFGGWGTAWDNTMFFSQVPEAFPGLSVIAMALLPPNIDANTTSDLKVAIDHVLDAAHKWRLHYNGWWNHNWEFETHDLFTHFINGVGLSASPSRHFTMVLGLVREDYHMWNFKTYKLQLGPVVRLDEQSVLSVEMTAGLDDGSAQLVTIAGYSRSL